MKADFYYNYSDKNYVYKLLDIIASNIDIYYKENTELINPTFMLDNAHVEDVNYIYVKEPVNRYYFVNDITYSQGRSYMKCSVDVLSTYFPAIKDKKCISKRSANHYNLYINDDKLNLRAETRTLTFPFQNGFKRSNNKKGFDFILTVNGGGATSNNQGGTTS